MTNDNFAVQAMNYSVGDNLNYQSTDGTHGGSLWSFWERDYYPTYHYSYPVYIQDRAKDKGKQAFEIIKVLKDKKMIEMRKVGDFIDLMDELIKIL